MTKENTKHFKAGGRIITRGDDARAAYLILKGKVSVRILNVMDA
jgi:CRP-like cAMP-binding protein